MRLLIAGEFLHPIYEQAFLDAWRELGHEGEAFAWTGHLRGLEGKVLTRVPLPTAQSSAINRALVARVEALRPEVVLIWRGTLVSPATYRALRGCSEALLVSYNNDDPFGPAAHGHVPLHHHLLWRWYLKSLPLVDLALVYRPVNVAEALAAGAPEAAVLMPAFIPARDRPLALTPAERQQYGCDVVFAGHHEPDGRAEHLRALVAAGLHVRVFGGSSWTPAALGEAWEGVGPVRLLVGEDYARALCGARMALCFLSRLNRDTYTRRCFEIPACGTLLLSERTDDLTRLFREDEEAVFFSGPEELVEKALWLKAHPEAAARIAAAGHQRVHADGHAIHGRARELARLAEALRSRRASA